MHLYEIPAAIRAAFDEIEVDEDTGEILGAASLDEVEGEASSKIESAGLYVRELDAEAAALKAEADRLTARRRSLERRVSRIKTLMMPAVVALGGKVKGPRLTVSVATTKAVIIDDIEAIPDAFCRVKVEADKTALGTLLKAGEVVPGTHIEESLSLRMR